LLVLNVPFIYKLRYSPRLNIFFIADLTPGNLREGAHLKDPGVDGEVILKWIFEKLDGDIDWIDLAQDRDRWRALLNTVLNLRFA
jgi:hypothetical protein